MRKFSFLIFIFSFLVASAFLLASNAQAETAGLSVNTSLVMLRFEAGKELEFSFSLKNQTKLAQKVHLTEKDIALGDENSLSFLDAVGGPSSWVTFQENDFVLPAGASKAVNGRVKIPALQRAGNLQMLTLVSFASANEEVQTGSKVEGSLGVYTLLTASDAQNATGKLERLQYPFFSSEQAQIIASYLNTGDVQFVPQGKMVVTNLLTKQSDQIAFENHFVFPGKKFSFSQTLTKLSPFGFYKIQATFQDGNKQLSEKTGLLIGQFFLPAVALGLLLLAFLFTRLWHWRKQNSTAVHGSD
ncbi:MAG: hypothetical protein WCJ51_00115 [Candidatus Moraniibacteriota bacterium]